MKSLRECKEVLSVYSGGPVVLAAGRDAVAHAEDFLNLLALALLDHQRIAPHHSDLCTLCSEIKKAIAQAEA